MKITVVGLGHVGTVAAAGFASAGHDVLAVDIDRDQVVALQGGSIPFHEPGLERRVKAGLQRGTLRFLDRDRVCEGLGEVVLIAVGTTSTQKGVDGLRQVRDTLSWLKSAHPTELVIAMKSSVPPGTGSGLAEELRRTGIYYAATPEFLREGSALHDWDFPDRIVIGVQDRNSSALDTMRQMYSGIEAPVMITDITSAEMIKYAGNAFLATRVSFINEIAALCDSTGASIDEVSKGLAMDHRMGTRMHAGLGYGGSCLPKDLSAASNSGLGDTLALHLLEAVVESNDRQRLLPLRMLRRRFNGNLAGLKVGILGLAFKPGTDDIRNAPSLDLIWALANEGVILSVFDPVALLAARDSLPSSARIAGGVEDAAEGVQALVLATEWPEFTRADWRAVSRAMRLPRLILDGRNALDPKEMGALRFEYVGVGRGRVSGGSPTHVPNGFG